MSQAGRLLVALLALTWGGAPDPAFAQPSTQSMTPAAAVVSAARPAPMTPIQITIDWSSNPPSADVLDRLVEERETIVRRILTVLDAAAPKTVELEWLAYPTLESKASATRDERSAHVDSATGKLHVAIDGVLRGDRMGLEAGLLFESASGAPATPILETGVATFFSTAWGGRGFEYWAARLHAAEAIPPLATILSPEWREEESPFLVQPVSGTLVAHLLTRWSRTGFVARYGSWRPDALEVAAMEAGWRYFLDGLLRERAEELRGHLDTRRIERETGLPELRGVNFAHEGYRRYDGYLSQSSDRSLALLAELGANSVAVLPYAFMADPSEPTPLKPPSRQGSETDEAVSRAIRSAQGEGLAVLLKPHVWSRGSWPGEIEMDDREDWDRFFESYERWIVHYALLAEIHEVPLFSVGVELSKATIGQEQRWRDLVQRVRQLYSGALVYAANWGPEFESLEFWDVFDYLGIDAYYPLSDDPDATDQALREGADAMLDRIERVQHRYSKPVLFTEIGFASTRGAWIRPWEGHLAEGPSGADQLRSYRAVLEAMESRRWIGGVFWWEWPSDLRRGRQDSRGFMPVGKPAQALLEEWFSSRNGAPIP